MQQHFTLALVVLTSVGAYVVGTKGLGLSGRSIGKALAKMLECVGITVAFFVVNLVVGVIVVLATRMLFQEFVSLYFADETLLVLSLLQGLTFHVWRQLLPPHPR